MLAERRAGMGYLLGQGMPYHPRMLTKTRNTLAAVEETANALRLVGIQAQQAMSAEARQVGTAADAISAHVRAAADSAIRACDEIADAASAHRKAMLTADAIMWGFIVTGLALLAVDLAFWAGPKLGKLVP